MTTAELTTIAEMAHQNASDCAKESTDHGINHWKNVAEIGLKIAETDSQVNKEVVFLFAAFHDTQRHNEFWDPMHGDRAAGAAEAIKSLARGTFEIPDGEMAKLLYALTNHQSDEVTRSNDPTIGACWDADRLTLWRVGQIPDVRFMSSEDVIERFPFWRDYAKDLVVQSPIDWQKIADAIDSMAP